MTTLNHKPGNNTMTLILFISALLLTFGAVQIKEALEA